MDRNVFAHIMNENGVFWEPYLVQLLLLLFLCCARRKVYEICNAECVKNGDIFSWLSCTYCIIMRAHITNEPVSTKAGKMYTNELFTCEVFNKHTASAGLIIR